MSTLEQPCVKYTSVSSTPLNPGGKRAESVTTYTVLLEILRLDGKKLGLGTHVKPEPKRWGGGCSSVVETLLSMHKVLGSIPSTACNPGIQEVEKGGGQKLIFILI